MADAVPKVTGAAHLPRFHPPSPLPAGLLPAAGVARDQRTFEEWLTN
jgi:hypothetical protein